MGSAFCEDSPSPLVRGACGTTSYSRSNRRTQWTLHHLPSRKLLRVQRKQYSHRRPVSSLQSPVNPCDVDGVKSTLKYAVINDRVHKLHPLLLFFSKHAHVSVVSFHFFSPSKHSMESGQQEEGAVKLQQGHSTSCPITYACECGRQERAKSAVIKNTPTLIDHCI